MDNINILTYGNLIKRNYKNSRRNLHKMPILGRNPRNKIRARKVRNFIFYKDTKSLI